MATREFILEKGTVVQYKGTPPFYIGDNYYVGDLAVIHPIAEGTFRLMVVQKNPPELVIPKEYC